MLSQQPFQYIIIIQLRVTEDTHPPPRHAFARSPLDEGNQRHYARDRNTSTSPSSPSTLRCRIVRAALAHRRRHSAEETKDAAHMSEDEGCTIVLQRLNWTRTTLISDLLDVFHVNGVEESSFWMKAILIQGHRYWKLSISHHAAIHCY